MDVCGLLLAHSGISHRSGNRAHTHPSRDITKHAQEAPHVRRTKARSQHSRVGRRARPHTSSPRHTATSWPHGNVFSDRMRGRARAGRKRRRPLGRRPLGQWPLGHRPRAVASRAVASGLTSGSDLGQWPRAMSSGSGLVRSLARLPAGCGGSSRVAPRPSHPRTGVLTRARSCVCRRSVSP